MTGEGTRLLTTYKSPLYDLDGSVMGTVGVAIDITQERAYEAEIVRKNQELEALFTTMDCGVMCHTLDGSRIIRVNRAALQILGYRSKEEMIADGFDTVASTVLDTDKPKLRECIQALTKEGDSVSLEYGVRHKSGEMLHVIGSVKLIEENGELIYQRFLLDCTTQKLQQQRERMDEQRRQMELVQALSVDYNLVCYFDLDTGIGGPLRVHHCRYDVLEDIFSDQQLILEESLGRYIERCVYTDDMGMMRRCVSRAFLQEQLTDKHIFYTNYRTICGD